MIASKADIIAYESLGFSHMVWRGESYFVNLDSKSSRLKFKEYLEKETGKEWVIADLERYIFYRKDMYVLKNGAFDNNWLELNGTFQGKVETPINTISCECMFSSKSLEGIDFSDFDTSGIEDMSNMFSECIFPEGFSLGNKFNTSGVKDMYNMFSHCTFSEGFSLGNKFDTSNVEDMQEMFYSCTFPEGFSLGDRFNTLNVKNMSGMFRDCTFSEGFNLGDKFDTSNVMYMYSMFLDARFNEDFSLAKDFTICGNAKGMFFESRLPKRVAKRLGSRTTEEEIVELLKSDPVTKVDF